MVKRRREKSCGNYSASIACSAIPMRRSRRPFAVRKAQVGKPRLGGIVEDDQGEHVLSHHQIAVRQGKNSRWMVFDIAEIVVEIRREEARSAGQPLPSVQICLFCGKELSGTGRTTRQYCNDRCRVADFRKRKEADVLITALQRSQLRRDFRAYHIDGPLLVMLQDIFVKYGEEAARAATNAVTWVLEGKPKPMRAKPNTVEIRITHQ